MKEMFILLAKRLKSSSPKLFSNIAIGAGIIGAMAITVTTLPITLPVWLGVALPLLASACGGITTVALFTTDDKKIINETKKLFANKNK